jgi:hypothetical protein
MKVGLNFRHKSLLKVPQMRNVAPKAEMLLTPEVGYTVERLMNARRKWREGPKVATHLSSRQCFHLGWRTLRLLMAVSAIWTYQTSHDRKEQSVKGPRDFRHMRAKYTYGEIP